MTPTSVVVFRGDAECLLWFTPVLATVTLLAGTAVAGGQRSGTDATAFAAALETCDSASFRHPHPLMHGFESAHAIDGMREGSCHYTQSMPGGMRMECAFDATQRSAFAAEFLAMAAGRLQGGSGETKSWQSACEIVTGDGKRMPLGG